MFASLIRKCLPARARPKGYINHFTWSKGDGKVQNGPFRGMNYIQESCGSCYVPKVLGIYERELYPVVEKAIAANFPLIVDIGAAEGYYAVGLATRCPNARVVGFEMEPTGQRLLREMVALNGQENHFEIRGKCEAENLQELLAPAERSLVVCDCEGFEKELLDPDRIPALKNASVLVEMHDFIIPGLTPLITERFKNTHTIDRIDQTERTPADYPYRNLYLNCLPGSYLRWAVDEWRPVRMHWLWMTPKAGM